MRAVLRSLGLILGLGIALLTAAAANAATITVTPTTVPAGGTVTVSGDVLGPSGSQPGCALPGTVLLFSAAFGDINTPIQAAAGTDAKYSAQATIPVEVVAGTYPVTGRCGGGNLGVQGTVVVTAAQLPGTGTGGLLAANTARPLASPGILVLMFLGVGALLTAATRLHRRSA